MKPVYTYFPIIFLQPERPAPPVQGRTAKDESPEAEGEESTDKGKILLCASCGRAITRLSEKTVVHNAHRHSFANPSGLIFEIGCFRAAPGCDYIGPASSEFTWFAGYQWRAALCRGCQAHLGWLFLSSGTSFHGLILSALVESRDE